MAEQYTRNRNLDNLFFSAFISFFSRKKKYIVLLLLGAFVVSLPLASADWVPPSLWTFFNGQALREADVNVTQTIFAENVTDQQTSAKFFFEDNGNVGVQLG